MLYFPLLKSHSAKKVTFFLEVAALYNIVLVSIHALTAVLQIWVVTFVSLACLFDLLYMSKRELQ